MDQGRPSHTSTGRVAISGFRCAGRVGRCRAVSPSRPVDGTDRAAHPAPVRVPDHPRRRSHRNRRIPQPTRHRVRPAKDPQLPHPDGVHRRRRRGHPRATEPGGLGEGVGCLRVRAGSTGPSGRGGPVRSGHRRQWRQPHLAGSGDWLPDRGTAVARLSTPCASLGCSRGVGAPAGRSRRDRFARPVHRLGHRILDRRGPVGCRASDDPRHRGPPVRGGGGVPGRVPAIRVHHVTHRRVPDRPSRWCRLVRPNPTRRTDHAPYRPPSRRGRIRQLEQPCADLPLRLPAQPVAGIAGRSRLDHRRSVHVDRRAGGVPALEADPNRARRRVGARVVGVRSHVGQRVRRPQCANPVLRPGARIRHQLLAAA